MIQNRPTRSVVHIDITIFFFKTSKIVVKSIYYRLAQNPIDSTIINYNKSRKSGKNSSRFLKQQNCIFGITLSHILNTYVGGFITRNKCYENGSRTSICTTIHEKNVHTNITFLSHWLLLFFYT